MLFTSHETISNFNHLLALGLLSDAARQALAEQVADLSGRLGWFAKAGRTGFAAAVAFSDGRSPFEASMSALKACHHEIWNTDLYRTPIVAAFPIVIIDAPMFESYLDEYSQLQLARIEQCDLFVAETIGRQPGTCVRFVTYAGLSAFAREAANELANLRDVLGPAIEEEWERLQANMRR